MNINEEVEQATETMEQATVLIKQYKQEIEHWRLVASYLASCHAATLESLPKSASKCSRKRYVEICRRAAAYLRGTQIPVHYGLMSKQEQIEFEINRCEEAVKRHEKE